MKQIFNTDNFKSKLFVRLFCSYMVIILSIFILFSVLIGIKSAKTVKDRINQYYNLMTMEIGTTLDVQFEEANVILASMKASDAFKNFNPNACNTSLSSTADVISQIKNDIFSTNNLNIYDAALWLEDSNRIYTSTQVFTVDRSFTQDDNRQNTVQLASLNSLYGLSKLDTIFQKTWLIYSEECSNVFSNGRISILFDQNSTLAQIEKILAEQNNVTFMVNETSICEKGTIHKSEEYTVVSSVDSEISYTLIVDTTNFKIGLSSFAVVAIIASILVVIIFILLALVLTTNYYEPVEHIEKMIGADKQKTQDNDEFTSITTEIQKLIGERNGYREQMITIKPYAQQGVLHGIMNGNIEADHVDVLQENEYMVLQKPYFMLSVINIEYMGKDRCDRLEIKHNRQILQEACNCLSNEDRSILLYDKDISNTFAIVNSNSNEGLTELYYQMHQMITSRISNRNYTVTIGVDEVREDITQINEACKNAVRTLGGMVVGGRGSVYFYEKEVAQDRHKYYFPKDAVNQVTKALRDRNMDGIKAFLDEILKVNMTKYDISLSTGQLLIDEVHITTVKALKNINELNTVDFNIEKMNKEATLEEVLEYYLAIYQTVCDKLEKLGDGRKETDALNQKIIQCINDKYCDCELSLQYLTEKFGVSNKHISIMCKKYLGVTYLQYLQEKRINKAVELMEHTEDSLEQIANHVGYGSLLTFRRNFKSIMGINPSEYMGRENRKG